MKAILMSSDNEMSKFKEIPESFITSIDSINEENTSCSKLPTIISSSHSTDIRNLIPQYSY